MFNIYVAFSFEKESNGQNHSLSDSHHLIKKFPSKISHFTHCGGVLFKSFEFGNGSRISDEKLVLLEFKYLQNKKW